MMDWKSVAAIVAGACAVGVPALSLAGKWLEVLDTRWKARALAAEDANAELQKIIERLELDNSELQVRIANLEARPSADTVFPSDIPPGSGLVTGW